MVPTVSVADGAFVVQRAIKEGHLLGSTEYKDFPESTVLMETIKLAQKALGCRATHYGKGKKRRGKGKQLPKK